MLDPKLKTAQKLVPKLRVKNVAKHSPIGKAIKPKLQGWGSEELEELTYEWLCSKQSVNPVALRQAKKAIKKARMFLIATGRFVWPFSVLTGAASLCLLKSKSRRC